MGPIAVPWVQGHCYAQAPAVTAEASSGVVVFSPQAALPCADTVTNPGEQVTGPRDGMQPRGTARNRSPLLPLPESSATCRASSPSMGCSRQSAQMPRRRSQTNRAPYHMVGHASLIQASIRMRRRPLPKQTALRCQTRGHQPPHPPGINLLRDIGQRTVAPQKKARRFLRWANSDTARWLRGSSTCIRKSAGTTCQTLVRA